MPAPIPIGGLPSAVILSLNFSTASSISKPVCTAECSCFASSFGALCICMLASPMYLIIIPSASSTGCVIASIYPFISFVSPCTSFPKLSPNGVKPRKSEKHIDISRFMPSLISAGFSCSIRTTVGEQYPANCFSISCLNLNCIQKLLKLA